MLKRLILTAALVGLLVQPAPAKVSVVLVDGRILEGVDVRRDGQDYALETSPGEVIIIPQAFVSEVRLEQDAPKEEEPPEEDPDAWRHKSGVIKGEARVLGGYEPEDVPGLNRDAKSEWVAGDPVEIPRTDEQLEVFGDPAKFQKGIIDPRYTLETDWDLVNGVNNWAPSEFSKSVVDHDWKPETVYGKDTDQLKAHESEWKESVIDSEWRPTDGFKKPDSG